MCGSCRRTTANETTILYRERPAMKNVYVVWACSQYEGSSPIRIYEDEAGAKAFEAECEVHRSKQPSYPALDCSDEEHEQWIKLRSAWDEAAPPDFLSYDNGFMVSVMPLHCSGGSDG